MSRLADYIASAIVLTLRPRHPADYPKYWEDLHRSMDASFSIDISENFLRAGVNVLVEWGLATVSPDMYAGDFLDFQAIETSGRIAQVGSPVLSRAFSGGADWMRRVLENAQFWSDLSAEVEAEKPLLNLEVEQAPASDRIVSFTDNQIVELDEQATLLIDSVSGQNQIDEQPGLREIVIGQLKAGRELIRAGSFKLFLMKITLIETLAFLAKRYEKEAIGALAASLMAAILKHIGIDA